MHQNTKKIVTPNQKKNVIRISIRWTRELNIISARISELIGFLCLFLFDFQIFFLFLSWPV